MVFKTNPLALSQWSIVIGLGILPSLASEISKAFIKKPK
jgi:hypothetical protein